MTIREPLPSVPWWVKAIVTTILAILGTMYTSNRSVSISDKASIVQRVATLEAHQQDDHEKLTYIQNQVDKLVTWALGKKD